MEIKITPKVFTCYEEWEPKRQGVVFVAKEEHIERVFRELVDQDSYWNGYKDLIQVAPIEITSVRLDLRPYCKYCGKTDIWNVKELKAKLAEKGIEIILFQYLEDED